MARDWFRPFVTAVNGVVYAFKTQRHMRVHLYVVVLVLLMGVYFNLRVRDLLVLLFMISFVVVAEMFNSAIEAVVDLVAPKYHPLAKMAKDMAAGGVLITSVTAMTAALLLLLGEGRWQDIKLQLSAPDSVQHVVPKLILGALVLFILVVVGKGLGKRGQVLRGGLVSGHAAFGFFLAGVIVFLTGNLIVSGIAIFLAAMIAQSRFESRIHSLFELSFGATLGILLAIFLFGVSRS
ncbi:MAG: diacylglycerol kinase [Fimbriimonadales bacterium]|nr:MAG: diacylglycerol kinase [Fimbriimonadales bacterium]